MTASTAHPFQGAARKPPTKHHRPAIWECMLGTVYAMDDNRQVRYFDYDWAAAKEFAGATPDRDLRVAKKTEHVRYTNDSTMEPRHGQYVLWVTK